MLVHCVFLNFSDECAADERMAVLRALGELKDEVDGILGYSYGPNRDFEGKSPDHNEGFIVTFRDREAHLAYERHPRHVELGGRLVEMCVGGADGIVVYDLEIQEDG
jgi:hypothetical protein